MLKVADCVWGEIEDLNDFPDMVWHGESSFHVSYVDSAESSEDGLVYEIALFELDLLPEFLPSWLVPGMLEERVYSLIRALPKNMRQVCSPARDAAQQFVEEWSGWEPSRFLEVELADYLSKRCGHIIDAAMFDLSSCLLYTSPSPRD